MNIDVLKMIQFYLTDNDTIYKIIQNSHNKFIIQLYKELLKNLIINEAELSQGRPKQR